MSRRKLTPHQVAEIRAVYAQYSHVHGGTGTVRWPRLELAVRFGVSPRTIEAVGAGSIYRDGPLASPPPIPTHLQLRAHYPDLPDGAGTIRSQTCRADGIGSPAFRGWGVYSLVSLVGGGEMSKERWELVRAACVFGGLGIAIAASFVGLTMTSVLERPVSTLGLVGWVWAGGFAVSIIAVAADMGVWLRDEWRKAS